MLNANDLKSTRFRALLLLLALVLALPAATSCKGSSIDSDKVFAETPSIATVYGAKNSAFSGGCSVAEQGVFYFWYNTMKYFDLDSGNSYVLCHQEGCQHSDRSCGAWYYGHDYATGLAQYGDSIYAFRRNDTSNTFDLVRMSMSDDNHEIIYSMKIGAIAPGEWVLRDIEHVSYSGSRAWFIAWYYYVVDNENGSISYGNIVRQVITGVDLANGSHIELNQLSLDDLSYYTIQFASSDYVVYEKRWDSPTQLSPEDLTANGEYPEFSDDYYWRWNNANPQYSTVLYSIESGEYRIIDEGYLQPYPSEEDVAGWGSRYIIAGDYNGELLVFIPDWQTGGSTVYLYNPNTDETSFLLDIDTGWLMTLANSGMAIEAITRDGSLLFSRNLEDGSISISRYSLETSEVTELFTCPQNNQVRIEGETDNYFIFGRARVYDDFGTPILYSISKDDFYNGNLDAAVKLKL